jgi:hypothetical protein
MLRLQPSPECGNHLEDYTMSHPTKMHP